MGRPVVHWELWSENPKQLADFYAKAFDWDIRLLEEMGYHFVETGGEGGIGGGIMKPQAGPWPGNMTFYIDVPDLADARDKITAAGGKIIVEEQHVPEVGSFCLFEDPDGRVLGCWKQTGPT